MDLQTQLEALIAEGRTLPDAVQRVKDAHPNASEEDILKVARAVDDRLTAFLDAPIEGKRRNLAAQLLSIAQAAKAVGALDSATKALKVLMELEGLQIEPGTVAQAEELTEQEIDARVRELISSVPKLRSKLKK